MWKADRTSFISQINALQQASSVQGKIYHSIRVEGSSVYFIRQGKSKAESINLEELYTLYQAIDHPTNTEARQFISGRVQSPAVSILNALGENSSNLKPIAQKENALGLTISPLQKNNTATADKVNDESRFFQAFTRVIAKEYVLSKSVGKPISSENVFLSTDFRKYAFPEELEKNFEAFLKELNSNFNFSAKNLAHHIDGLLLNHPELGTRIVEFDEEQHFTPSLFTALQIQSGTLELDFTDYYTTVLADLDYLNAEVLKKNRIKQRFDAYPTIHDNFNNAIGSEKVSGYKQPIEKGFNYVGGRIAQRAYYDSLRNAAHLSPKNQGFNSILRFPKKYFEDKAGTNFSKLGTAQVEDYIREYLLEIYGYHL